DDVADLLGGQDGRRQLVHAVPRDEDLPRLDDPDLLDGRVVEVGLQRAIAGDVVQHLLDHTAGIGQRLQGTGHRALVVVGDRVLDQAPDAWDVPGGVEPATPDQLANLVGDDRYWVHR